MFCDEPADDDTILEYEDMAQDRLLWDETSSFFQWFQYTLYKDESRFWYRFAPLHNETERLIAIGFDDKVQYIDTAMPGNLSLHMLLCLSWVLSPIYEIRRYRESKSAYSDIIMPMTPQDWETLETQYGKEAVDAKFERITANMELKVINEEWLDGPSRSA